MPASYFAGREPRRAMRAPARSVRPTPNACSRTKRIARVALLTLNLHQFQNSFQTAVSNATAYSFVREHGFGVARCDFQNTIYSREFHRFSPKISIKNTRVRDIGHDFTTVSKSVKSEPYTCIWLGKFFRKFVKNLVSATRHGQLLIER